MTRWNLDQAEGERVQRRWGRETLQLTALTAAAKRACKLWEDAADLDDIRAAMSELRNELDKGAP